MTGQPSSFPRITAAIPLFNKDGMIRDCIASIAAQTVPVEEVIVVDDGSTDGSASIADQALREFGLRGKVIRQANAGVSAARNAAVSNVATDYVAFLDADDEWTSHFIERMGALVREFPDAALYGCAHTHTEGAAARVVRPNVSAGFRGYLPDFFLASVHGAAVNSSKAVVSKRALQDIGGFPEGVGIGEDIYVWMRLASKSRVAFDDFVGASVMMIDEGKTVNRRGVPYPIVYYAKTGTDELPASGRILLRRVLVTYCLDRAKRRDLQSVAESATAAKPLFPLLARALMLLERSPAWLPARLFALGRQAQRLLRARSSRGKSGASRTVDAR
jgi:glycosyltransferase involved in cell wall biosynthesis